MGGEIQIKRELAALASVNVLQQAKANQSREHA
jgi:hypothetical protein